jgi:hypothetical protein
MTNLSTFFHICLVITNWTLIYILKMQPYQNYYIVECTLNISILINNKLDKINKNEENEKVR